MMEFWLLTTLRVSELNYGTGLITPINVGSLAASELFGQFPVMNTKEDIDNLRPDSSKEIILNVALRQLAVVTKHSWMRSFLSR